jgi:hypothetical protein
VLTERVDRILLNVPKLLSYGAIAFHLVISPRTQTKLQNVVIA